MPRRYVIENGAENNRWLYKIERAGRSKAGETTCFYSPHILDAIVYKKKEEAVSIARKWKARVWQLKGNIPTKQVFPE